MHRSFSLIPAVVVAVASVLQAHAAPLAVPGAGRTSDGAWRLGVAYYPKGTNVVAASAVSNVNLQDFTGALHLSRYAALGRIDRRGWLQIGTFARTTGHGAGRVRHVLSWSYAVSYYRTAAAAWHAVRDIRKKMAPLSDMGPYGRVARFLNGAGDRETFSTLGHDTTVIELVCSVRPADVRRFKQLLSQYCGEQRLALARRALSRPAAPTATPHLTATPGNPPVSGSTATAAVTATPVTAVPTGTATPTVTISTPTLSFYMQGSPDTCALSEPTTSFPNTVPEMYVKALFSAWHGTHEVIYEWYAPDGSLFFSTTYSGTDLGSAILCAWMTIDGTTAATLIGTWTLRLRIDGRESASAPFTLTDARTPQPLFARL